MHHPERTAYTGGVITIDKPKPEIMSLDEYIAGAEPEQREGVAEWGAEVSDEILVTANSQPW